MKTDQYLAFVWYASVNGQINSYQSGIFDSILTSTWLYAYGAVSWQHPSTGSYPHGHMLYRIDFDSGVFMDFRKYQFDWVAGGSAPSGKIAANSA